MSENDLLPYAKLKLNIDLPMVEEVWLDGYESAQNDVNDESNPYAKSSIEYTQWQEGWWAGFYEEDPLFNITPEATASSALPMDEHFDANQIMKRFSLKNIWQSIQSHHWYIRLWHIMTACLGYLIVYELMDLLVYIE